MRAPSLPDAVRQPVSAGTAVAVLAPAVYLPCLVAVQELEHGSVIVQSWFEVVAFAVVVSVVGVVGLLAWRWRLRVTPVATILALGAWPWVVSSRPIWNRGYVYPLFVAVGFVLAVEAAVRRRRRVTTLLDRPAIAVGLAHVFVGFLLQMAVRSLSFSSQWVVVLMWTVILSAVALVLFATGALPVVFWRHERLIAPAVVAAGWFAWGVYDIWTWRESLPLTAFQSVQWAALEPAPDYAYQSTTLLLVLLVVAGGEYVLREVAQVAMKQSDAKEQ